jgi:purine-binding chemotaxis protein CheW
MSSEQDASSEATCSATGKRVEGAQPLLAFADALLSASQGEPGRAVGEIRQYVTFFLRDDEVGIPILQCREIIHAPAITRVPESPEHVLGVVNLRGHILPAVDTRKCLGYEGASPTAKARLIVVEVAGRLFALLVDRVARILKVAASEILPLPENAKVSVAIGVVGTGHQAIYLTDAERILRAGPGAESQPTRSEEA